MRTIFIIFFSLVMIGVKAQERIMVISGGGAKGAWGGGVAQALHEKEGHQYKMVLGTSTGSLMAPFITINAYDELKEGYTNVTDKDIFNVRPFKIKGKKRGQLKKLSAFFRILIGKKSLGETKRLRKTIKRFFTPFIFNQIQNNPRQVSFLPTVVNINTSVTEFKSSKDYEYEDMVNWMWASSNQPVFMTLYKRKVNGKKQFYVDGGLKDFIPIIKAIQLAHQEQIKNVDVIVHSKDHPTEDRLEKISIIKLITRTMEVFSNDVKENDLYSARLLHQCAQLNNASSGRSSDNIVTVSIYYMPNEDHDLVSNSLLFDKQEMLDLWQRGYKFVGASYQKNHTITLSIDPKATIESDELTVKRP